MTEEGRLNEKQREAVEHKEGPLLIIAGAGTGKTTVITERIKHLILGQDVIPSHILALTFTEKAAREMEERVDVILPYGYTELWISTFHAFCDRILRNEAIHIGLTPSYKLATEAESILFLRKHLFFLDLDYFRPLGNPTKFLTAILQHFNRLRDEDVTPQQYLAFARKLNARRYTLDDEKEEVKKTLELARAFTTYQDLKAKEGIFDFADLIASTLTLFRTRKNILKNYQEQFPYVLVDEFQDTNFAQNELAILLAGAKQNITVVGDDDQAIYRWRGAAIANIIQFKKHFPHAKVVTLTKNYRSTEEILARSYALIQHNNPDRLEVKEHIDKKLTSTRKVKGEPAALLFADRVENEAEAVVKKIKELTSSKVPYQFSDIAILVRANDHAHPFTRALERHRIPYQFLGPGQLFHQEEVKDLIAYLRVLANFDDSASLYRVLTMPLFSLEARDIAAILNFAKRKNDTLFEALEKVDETFIKEETRKAVKKLVDMINRHLKRVPKDTAGQILYYFLEDSGLLKQFLSAKTQADEKRAENVAKFFEKLKTFEGERTDASVFSVVDWIDLSMQMGESPLAADMDWSNNNAVNILTVHSSKGLEFPVVFVVNLVTQRFPTRERREQIPIPQELIKEILPEGDYHLQEERRLFYVAMTRARDYLFLSAAHFYGEGKRERKISPFVHEALGEEAVASTMSKKHESTQLTLLEWAQPPVLSPTIKHPSSASITYLSYSQIQTFDICPLHYKLRYILKIPSAPTAAQSFGTSIHATLRDTYRQAKNEKLTLKDTLALLSKSWVNDGYHSREHEKKAFDKAKAILENYFTKYFDPIKLPLAVELPFTFMIKKPASPASPPGGLKVGGRIDRIDQKDNGAIEIIDYKTGGNMLDEKELASNLQLTLYALAAVEVNDPILRKKPEEVVLTLHYLEKDVVSTTTRTAKQLEEAKEFILTKADAIAQSTFPCSASSICATCEYKMLCQV